MYLKHCIMKAFKAKRICSTVFQREGSKRAIFLHIDINGCVLNIAYDASSLLITCVEDFACSTVFCQNCVFFDLVICIRFI